MIRASRVFSKMEDGKMTQVKMTAYSDEQESKLWIVTATGKLLSETKRRGDQARASIRKTWANLQKNLERKGFSVYETIVVDDEAPF